ncbi:oligosaccharide flippase family protein [Alteromonas stellipolaris]|uniref:oligosaccharide flippase family protein n=1 Tax=Alteromonas stellipolaris TaxID=233316 RepID=UPI002494A6ED|nr:oligosaccharide flippase family protein [Alteromonas stellipolaris]
MIAKTNSFSLFKDIASVFFTKVFVLFVGLISAVLLARALGAEGRGIVAAVLIYPNLLIAITEGGMRQSAVLFLGQNKAPDSYIIGALVSYMMVAGVAGYILVYWLMFTMGESHFSTAMMAVAAAILPVTLATNALKGIFLGKEKIKEFNKVTWIQKIFYVAGIAAFYFFDSLTVLTAVLVTFLAAGFNLIQAVFYLKKKHLFSFEFNSKTFFTMFRIGIVYAVALFFIQANYKVDILILSWLSTPEEVGNYAVAVQIGELLWQLPAAVLVVLMSKTANSKGSEIVNTLCKTTRITLLITLLSCFGLLGVSYYLIQPVFGESFANAFPMLLSLSVGLVLAAVFKSVNSYFAGKGNPYFTIKLMGTAVAINVGLNYWLIPQYGGVGAGIASTVSYTFSAIGVVIALVVKEKVSPSDLLFTKLNDFKPLYQKIHQRISVGRK